MSREKDRCIVIGAGMGGLAAALRLASAGEQVLLLEAQASPGGKMRVLPSAAGPVDAGPTVLTLRDVLDDLFAQAGTSVADHLTLQPLGVLARHFWADGARLDLFATPEANADAIGAAFGPRARAEFTRFDRETRALFAAFDAPVMRRDKPALAGAGMAMLRRPALLPWLMPGRSLDAMLRARLSDPHLRQLFGRYATYVGGNPLRAPALLALIWQAEAAGVWAVQGGMARLAQVLAKLLQGKGGEIRYNTPVAAILSQSGQVSGVRLTSGAEIPARSVLFNGDPRALRHLLDCPKLAPAKRQTSPRSLSAQVWTLAAQVDPPGLGQDALAYHSVFFADDPAQEFGPLARGEIPQAPTIYVCAQDRATLPPKGPERFQFILNAPAVSQPEAPPCPIDPFARLARFGLHLTVQTAQVTHPQDFAALFPHSMGALYGLSPDTTMASFHRPTARSPLTGLYLAGGGVHPGAGVPMAILSGKHAAQALMDDRISPAMSRRMAMRGGMLTGSATAARAPSR